MVDEIPSDVKPGYKTTEFWLSLIATLVGAVLALVPSTSKVGQICGVVSMVLGALGYTVVRGGVKKAAQVFVLVLLPFFMIGCNKGMVRADAIDGLTTDVCDRHDAMISGKLDPKSISEADKATFLRSSAILRKVLQEAKN